MTFDFLLGDKKEVFSIGYGIGFGLVGRHVPDEVGEDMLSSSKVVQTRDVESFLFQQSLGFLPGKESFHVRKFVKGGQQAFLGTFPNQEKAIMADKEDRKVLFLPDRLRLFLHK